MIVESYNCPLLDDKWETRCELVQSQNWKLNDDCAQMSFSELQLPNQFKPLIGHPVKPWELNVSVRSCR